MSAHDDDDEADAVSSDEEDGEPEEQRQQFFCCTNNKKEGGFWWCPSCSKCLHHVCPAHAREVKSEERLAVIDLADYSV